VTTVTLLPATTTSTTTGSATTSSTLLSILCVVGGCDDGDPCTADACDLVTGCYHTPLSGPGCDTAALPPDPDDGKTCTLIDLDPTGGCTDDGLACTDELCTVVGCLHVPVDSRCVSPGQCAVAACRPASPDHDAAGCVAGPPRLEGEPCADDADTCTVDVCRAGECVHDAVVPATTCQPVQEPFRQTLALADLADSLVADAQTAPPDTATALVAQLDVIHDQLEAAARALAGETTPATQIVSLVRRRAIVTDLSSRTRARVAFRMLLRTPREITSFLQLVAEARTQLATSVTRNLRRNGRRLLRGTNSLRRHLRYVAHARLAGNARARGN